MDDYRLIADRVAADIAAGILRPGDRLATQRRFAREHGIAPSTAARVYGELVRRGLAVGEVGRGTFVRAGQARPDPALVEPVGGGVDLELNFPVLPDEPALLARGLDALLLSRALRPVGVTGTPQAREAAARMLARPGWAPDPDQVVFTGSGRQAIAATLAAVVPTGERLGVEAITYPVVKSAAGRLGVTLVPLAMDEQGVTPAALRDAGPLRAVYLQPALHNPLGVSMSGRRRADLAEVLGERDITAIEDSAYGFLHDEPPLAGLAPERTVLLDSMSKRAAPGLTLGFVAAPPALVDRVASAVRSGGWAAGRFALDAVTGWLTDGTAAHLQRAKRADAVARQDIVRAHLDGFAITADPRSYHCWWRLPDPWRAETFVAAAARRGIAVTPAAAFAVGAAHAPNAVRMALATPSHAALAAALDTLAALARATPEDSGVD